MTDHSELLLMKIKKQDDRIEALHETIRWMAQTVHQGHHGDFALSFRECQSVVCDVARKEISRDGGKI